MKDDSSRGIEKKSKSSRCNLAAVSVVERGDEVAANAVVAIGGWRGSEQGGGVVGSGRGGGVGGRTHGEGIR